MTLLQSACQEDLSSIPRKHTKKPGIVACSPIPSSGEAEIGRPRGLLTNQPSGPGKIPGKPYLKKQGEQCLRFISEVDIWPPYAFPLSPSLLCLLPTAGLQSYIVYSKLEEAELGDPESSGWASLIPAHPDSGSPTFSPPNPDMTTGLGW